MVGTDVARGTASACSHMSTSLARTKERCTERRRGRGGVTPLASARTRLGAISTIRLCSILRVVGVLGGERNICMRGYRLCAMFAPALLASESKQVQTAHLTWTTLSLRYLRQDPATCPADQLGT
eukprot:1264672-Rhodomonas_salina.1